MSILLLAADNNRATVVVDTLESGGRHCSKLQPLSHLGAVVAGRGRGLALSSMAWLLGFSQSFDEAADKLEDIFHRALAHLPIQEEEMATANGTTLEAVREKAGLHLLEYPTAQEILLVGHSERLGRVEAIHIKRLSADEPTTVLRGAGAVVAPPCEALNEKAEQLLATDAGALEFVRTLYAQEKGKPGFGGRAIVARVSAKEIIVRDLGAL